MLPTRQAWHVWAAVGPQAPNNISSRARLRAGADAEKPRGWAVAPTAAWTACQHTLQGWHCVPQ